MAVKILYEHFCLKASRFTFCPLFLSMMRIDLCWMIEIHPRILKDTLIKSTGDYPCRFSAKFMFIHRSGLISSFRKMTVSNTEIPHKPYTLSLLLFPQCISFLSLKGRLRHSSLNQIMPQLEPLKESNSIPVKIQAATLCSKIFYITC